MIRNRPKVYLYYGPSSKVHTDFTLPALGDSISLTQYVRLTDPYLLRPPEELVKLPAKKLVAFPEEYFGVTENFVHSFWSRLDENPVEEVYLINPPLQIVKQAKLHSLEPTEHYHSYQKLDKAKIASMHKTLGENIHGQDESINRVIKNIIPLLSQSATQPVVMMFFGPAGVGKTETVRLISQELGGELFRAQFSMMQTLSLSEYLYGSKTSDRSFSSDLLERETNVLLFDEFDKTTEHFHSAFYQLFDEGVFKDKNYEVKIGNAIIICTSNYGSLPQIKQHLGDALYSRISGFVEFRQLNAEAKKSIAVKALDQHLSEVDGEFKKALPASDELYVALEKYLAECKNAREIKTVIKYYISGNIYDQIIGNNKGR